MKKHLGIILLLICALVSVPALARLPEKPDGNDYVYDYTDTLSESDKDSIRAYGQALEEATQAHAVAVIVDALDGEAIEDYATDLINQWGIGDKTRDDGMVVLLSLLDREVWIGTGSGIDRTMTASIIGQVIDESALDYFRNDQFDKGMVALYQAACTRLASQSGKRLSVGGSETNGNSSYTSTYAYDDQHSEGGFLEGIFALVVAWVIISAVINSLFRRRSGSSGCAGGCLKYLFLGSLFDHMNRRPPRSPRPPRMGGFGGGFTPPRGGFGGGSRGGFGGGSPRSGGFGGGGSRGGGGGRKF